MNKHVLTHRPVEWRKKTGCSNQPNGAAGVNPARWRRRVGMKKDGLGSRTSCEKQLLNPSRWPNGQESHGSGCVKVEVGRIGQHVAMRLGFVLASAFHLADLQGHRGVPQPEQQGQPLNRTAFHGGKDSDGHTTANVTNPGMPGGFGKARFTIAFLKNKTLLNQ